MFLVVNRCSQLLLPYLLSSFLNPVDLVHFDIAKDLVHATRPPHFQNLGRGGSTKAEVSSKIAM